MDTLYHGYDNVLSLSINGPADGVTTSHDGIDLCCMVTMTILHNLKDSAA